MNITSLERVLRTDHAVYERSDRLHQIVSERTAVEIAKRGYRTNEPDPIQPETSQVLSKVFAALRKEGIGKADIARELNFFAEELDDFVFHLAMLPLAGEGAGGLGNTAPRHRLTVIPGGSRQNPLPVQRGERSTREISHRRALPTRDSPA